VQRQRQQWKQRRQVVVLMQMMAVLAAPGNAPSKVRDRQHRTNEML
jgi:hypothetical protein